MKLKALQKRIKGGGNAISFINQDAKTTTNSDSSLILTSSLDEDNDWDKSDERFPADNTNSVTEISVLYKLNYDQDSTCAANANDLIIPNQEYEYTKMLRTFLKDKKNIEKLTENEYENEIKNKLINKDKLKITTTHPKLCAKEKTSVNTYPIGKRQDKLAAENLKDLNEVNCYHDSLEFHKKLFQNNWNVLLNVYSFCKYESGSMSSNNSDSINNPPSLLSSLSNSGFSSIGSTCSTSLAHSWSTSISYDSAKSNSSSLDEFKMYVDSIGVTANREIILKGSLSDKIKGGLEKTEAVSLNKQS